MFPQYATVLPENNLHMFTIKCDFCTYLKVNWKDFRITFNNNKKIDTWVPEKTLCDN